MRRVLICIGVFLLGYSGLGAVNDKRQNDQKTRSFYAQKGGDPDTGADA